VLKHRNRILSFLFIGGDFVAIGLAFVAAYFFRFYGGVLPAPEIVPPFSQYLKILPLILVVFPLIFNLNGLYKFRRGRSTIDEIFGLFVAASLSTLIVFLSLLYYRVYYTPEKAPEWEFSRLVMAVFLVFTIILAAFMRYSIHKIIDSMRRRGINTKKVLIAGAGELGRQLVDRIVAHDEFGFKIVGFIDDDKRKRGSVYQGARVIGTLSDYRQILHDHRVNTLFVCLPPNAHHKIFDLIDISNKELVDVRVVPDLLQYISLSASVEEFDGLPIINFDLSPLSGHRRVMKRLFDLAFSIVGLAFTAVMFPFLAAAVKLSSPGPIFFKQERMGLDGKPFTLYKFRTMRINAESRGPVWAATDDPRATRTGRFMRKTSLDELPQFWNVLKGEMSLIGPRPERPEFVQLFKERIPKYMLRHKVKAGLSGWAQVNGWRGDTSIEKRIEYDLYYIQNWSLALDLKIIWLTLSRSMLGRSSF